MHGTTKTTSPSVAVLPPQLPCYSVGSVLPPQLPCYSIGSVLRLICGARLLVLAALHGQGVTFLLLLRCCCAGIGLPRGSSLSSSCGRCCWQ